MASSSHHLLCLITKAAKLKKYACFSPLDRNECTSEATDEFQCFVSTKQHIKIKSK
jgi:hypothetical protein